jgi:hypothetical protein
MMKKSAKVLRNPLSAPIWETPPAFYRDRFGTRDGGFCTDNPHAEEVRGLEAFLYEEAQNLKF